MKKIGKRVFLDVNDSCPICNMPVRDMHFRWNIADGEATSDCCGAIYQIKDYYIEKPTKQEKKCLELLRNGYIEFKIKEDWIEPLKEAIRETGIKDINNRKVFNFAKDIKTGEYPGIEYTTKDMDQLLHNTFRDDIRLLVESYYRDVMEMIEIGGFSFLGHFDVVKKTNSGNRYFDETAQWYRDAAAKALERVHKMGIIMEVNTGNSRWTDEGSIYPSPWILHLAKKKDIPVILNSDAHKPDRIDAHFPEALRILKDAGYREIVYLKGKKIIPQKLS